MADAFYLPGIAPTDYTAGMNIQVLANRLTSPSNTLPYSYYTLPFCQPLEPVRSKPVNLGQILVGERAFPTKFNLQMMRDETCTHMCTINLSTITDIQYNRLIDRISDNYSARLIADNMPLVMPYLTKSGIKSFRFGYRLGYRTSDGVFMNNHLKLKILYHQPSLSSGEAVETFATQNDVFRIVGFEAEPYSVGYNLTADGRLANGSCPSSVHSPNQEIHRNSSIPFTYDAQFVATDLAWATRWDPILTASSEIKQIHWFSIVNSLMVSLFLTALVGTVMLRTVLKDFGRYNAIVSEDEDDELTGWKNVHGDVFRPPRYAPFLSICVGSGSQVVVMAVFTQIFALIGFLSPANRGGLLTALLTIWVMASSVSGYASARLYSCIDTGVPRRMVTLGTALLFPGLTFCVFFLLNVAMWSVGSSGSVPFSTLLLLLFMWFGISVPLVFVGSYLGFSVKRCEFPVRTNRIERQIPAPPFNVTPGMYAIVAGILPFGTVFMELVFILNSVWSGSVYYLYGALLAVYAILMLVCAEMSIVSTYLSLSAEDWASHWHTSFWGCGSAGLYMFLYSLYFVAGQRSNGRIPFVSSLVFVCWSMVVSTAFSLMCGTVGFFASFWFTRKIYGSIRID